RGPAAARRTARTPAGATRRAERGGQARRARDPGRARAARGALPAGQRYRDVSAGAPEAAPLAELVDAVRSAAASVRGGVGELSAQPRLERSRRADQGDYSTNAAMLLAPVHGAPPRQIAEPA